MKATVFALFALLLVAVVQAKYEFTQTAKDCMRECGTTEDAIEPLIVTVEKIDDQNALVKKFLGCCFRTFITDTNDLIVDDKFTAYITQIFTTRMGGKRKLATIMATDCIKKCKDQKGDTKDDTAVKITQCLLTKFFELRDEK